jgi:AraC-like DNA-binding protein
VAELSGNATDAVIQLQAAQILIKLAEMYETLHSSKRVKTVVYVNRALNFINTHYHENIKAQDIARHAGINKNYLQRRFKEGTGKTITEYLSEKRMEKAKQLLEKTDIPIADLCLYVGINSRQYFTAVFTNKMGMSPQKYRQSFINSSWE